MSKFCAIYWWEKDVVFTFSALLCVVRHSSTCGRRAATSAPDWKQLAILFGSHSSLLAKMKCSICSYQLNLWYVEHQLINLIFEAGWGEQELALALSHVASVLHYRRALRAPERVHHSTNKLESLWKKLAFFEKRAYFSSVCACSCVSGCVPVRVGFIACVWVALRVCVCVCVCVCVVFLMEVLQLFEWF